MRLQELAAVGDRRVCGDELERSDSDLVPHQNRRAGLLRPLTRLAERPRRFRRQRHAERHPETEIAKRLVLLPRGQTLSELDDSDVARVANDVGERKPLRLVQIIDHPSVELELAAVRIYHVGGPGAALLE